MRAPHTEPSNLEGGWALQARGGRPIRLVFGDTELTSADLGLVVGRHNALCDRTIDDVMISRRHCRFSMRNERLFVEDLNSLNGTLVDGTDLPPFSPTALLEGQTVTLGRLVLRVRRIGSTKDQ